MNPIFENTYLLFRLLKAKAKLFIINQRLRKALFASRYLRFRLEQTLSQHGRKWHFGQYVSDFAHDVLLIHKPPPVVGRRPKKTNENAS
jgi:hypothetical protein